MTDIYRDEKTGIIGRVYTDEKTGIISALYGQKPYETLEKAREGVNIEERNDE